MPAGSQFFIIDEGYLDEDDGAEGFLELDEGGFWVYDDDSAAWFQRRFQGRRMKRGQKERRKGKGKGGKREDSFAKRKSEARLQKSNKKLGKHGTDKKVAMTKINGHGSHNQKSPIQ